MYIRGIGKLKLVVTEGINGKKYFMTNRLDWDSKKVIGTFLNRWEIEIMHREMKGDGLKRAWLRVRCGITSYMMLNALVQTLLEISTVISLSNTHLEFRSVTPEMRYRWVAIEVVMN
ncbi:MAG: hypothetical protein ACP5H0_07770 [Caldisericum sp.]|uniref:hypothetical protein n=1 Tax=Caldisericum sp. TaxID=2499687 RepID=UPI003D1132F3